MKQPSYHLSTLNLMEPKLNRAGPKHCGMLPSEHAYMMSRANELREWIEYCCANREAIRAAIEGKGKP